MDSATILVTLWLGVPDILEPCEIIICSPFFTILPDLVLDFYLIYSLYIGSCCPHYQASYTETTNLPNLLAFPIGRISHCYMMVTHLIFPPHRNIGVLVLLSLVCNPTILNNLISLENLCTTSLYQLQIFNNASIMDHFVSTKFDSQIIVFISYIYI